MSNCGVETNIKDLIDNLKKNVDFSTDIDLNFKNSDFELSEDLNNQIKDLTTSASISDVADLENKKGSFDIFSKSSWDKLYDIVKKNNLSSNEIAKVYLNYVQICLQSGIQFTLSKDQNAQQALLAQIQLQSQKADLIKTKADVLNSLSDLELKKLQALKGQIELANADVTYCSTKFNLEKILPAQLEGLLKDNQLKDISAKQENYKLEYLLPLEKQLQEAQIKSLEKDLELKDAQILNAQADSEYKKAMSEVAKLDAETKKYTVENLLPKQLKVLESQISLQTTQGNSYFNNDQLKLANQIVSTWNVQKGVDDAISPPQVFTNASIDIIIKSIANNLQIDLSNIPVNDDNTDQKSE